MAITPGSRRNDPRTTVPGDRPPDRAPLGAAQEPLDPMDRPISRTSDDNDVNLASTETRRTTGTTEMDRRAGRGFTTTFAIIAVVLLAAFLVAMYFGAEGTNIVTTPSDTVPPVADTAPATPPATTDDATGSTTIVEPAPAPEGTATGTGTTTAPAEP